MKLGLSLKIEIKMIENSLYHSFVEMILFKYIKMQIKTQEFGVENLWKEKNIPKITDIWLIQISKLEESLN
jgi:hypothetical protein